MLLIVIAVATLLLVGAVAAYVTVTALHERKSRNFHDDTEKRQSAEQAALARASDRVGARAKELQDLGAALAGKRASLQDRVRASTELTRKLQGDVGAALKALDGAWAALNKTPLQPLRDQLAELGARVASLKAGVATFTGQLARGGALVANIRKADGFIRTVQDKLQPGELASLKAMVDAVDLVALQARIAALQGAVTDLSARQAALVTSGAWGTYSTTVVGVARTAAAARLAAVDAAVTRTLPQVIAAGDKCRGAQAMLGRVGGLLSLGATDKKLTVNAPTLCVQDVCLTQAMLDKL